MRGLTLLILGLLGTGLLRGQVNSPPPPSTTTPASAPAASPATLGPAFRTACWKGDLAEATRLLDQGAPIEGRDNQGRTGLFLACHGNPDVVKFLLARGAKIDALAFNGDTTLAHACEYGDLTSAQMLLAAGAGADINKPNKYGHTPLMLAAREGRDQLVSLLIEQHVDLNFEGNSDSALFFAVGKDHLSIAEALLEAGAHTTRPVAAESPNRTSRALLVLAAWTDDVELIDLLLAHGADINGMGDDGVLVISDALWGSKPATIQHLLEKGADPNLGDTQGQTGLMYATDYTGGPILQTFLDHGAKVEAKDKQGRTALMWACFHHYETAIRFLIEHGADINAVDLNGDTPLTYAADRGETDIVQFLKDHGAKRTEAHVIARNKPVPPLPPGHAWALAVGAIYPQTNGTNPYVLGYDTPGNIGRVLKAQWEITDRASFLKVIDRLRSSAHHSQIVDTGNTLAAMNDVEFSTKVAALSADDARQAKALRASYLKWKERSGLAGDLCRAANLISLGFQIHYINEQEAWYYLMPIARDAQAAFGSWQEMSDNFLDAREIWDGTRDPHFEACAKLLLNPNDPNSPWNQNPWKTDLSATN